MTPNLELMAHVYIGGSLVAWAINLYNQFKLFDLHETNLQINQMRWELERKDKTEYLTVTAAFDKGFKEGKEEAYKEGVVAEKNMSEGEWTIKLYTPADWDGKAPKIVYASR